MVERKTGTHVGWDSYWKGVSLAGEDLGGVRHPAVSAFWEDLFECIDTDYSRPRLLDLGTGSGALVQQAQVAVPESRITCVDRSEFAIEFVTKRFPNVAGITADAAALPCANAEFDVLVSQFGVEYAGLDAVADASRLVDDGGLLAFVMHHHESLIHEEYTRDLDAIGRFIASRFIEHAVEMFQAGFNARDGGDRAPYEEAGSRLKPAMKAVEAIIDQYGESVANGTVATIYATVARIHQQLARYDAGEVVAWATQMDNELVDYRERIESMLGAALRAEDFNEICQTLGSRGMRLIRSAPLRWPGEDMPVAWALVAVRSEDEGRSVFRLAADRIQRGKEELRRWVESTLKKAIGELMVDGRIQEEFFEHRPAWVMPFKVVLGRVRRPLDADDRQWVICGEVPTDTELTGVASSPRDAARHFALKWQLEAAKQPESPETLLLVAQAEALYELVEDDNIWS